MGFLAPWFLAGAAAVGLPVWLHLLKRHKTTPQPFSSLMFFEPRTQSSIKHRRLQYLLLFALRTLFVLLLVLAFANPFLQVAGGPAASGRKLLVLAVDNSFSMRQGDRLEHAREQASRALSSLHAGDRAQVLAFNAQVRMMSDTTEDRTALQAALRSIKPTDARGSYAELTRALRSIAQSARVPVEAHVFSDMQKSSWPQNFSDLRLPEGVKLFTHAVSERPQPNFAVENVNVPHRVYNPRKARLQATIAGYGTEQASRRVSLVLNGRDLESKTVEVPPSGRATVEFLSLEVPYGLNRGEIRMEPADSLAADDHFYFSVERADPGRTLFVHESRDARSLLYFRTALDSSGQSAFEVDAVTPDQAAGMAPSKYAFVVLANVSGIPPEFEKALRDYVRAGGSVLISLGRESAIRHRVPLFDEGIVAARYFAREDERFQTAAWLDPAHPAIGSGDHWGDVKFYQAVRVQPGNSRIAARLSDDTPLLLDKQIGEGRVLVFASTFDNISNDFPLHPSFVPFVEQTAQYLGRLDASPANLTVGAYLELREARDRQKGAAVEVLDPSGGRALSLEEATRAQSLPVSSAGFYDVRRPNGRHELVAVNSDRRESDLDLIPAETLALWQNTAQGANTAADGSAPERKPVSFWWYVLAAALALALAESLVGNRHLSVEKEAA